MATLVVIEDHPIVRHGIRTLLQDASDLSIVAETGDGREGLHLVEDLKPDVALVDLTLPGLDGLELTRRIKHRSPRTQVAIFSMHSTEAYVSEALRNGAAAYIDKASGIEDLELAIREVLAGKQFLSPSLRHHQIESEAKQVSDRYATLTAREREVLHLVAEGYTSAGIAEKLFISVRTAETHRSNLMAKLGVHVQAELVRYALGRGLIPLTGKPAGRKQRIGRGKKADQ